MAKRVSWQRMEADLRRWALRVYFYRTFADEEDLTMRFIKAVDASTQPVGNRKLVRYWYGLYGNGRPATNRVSA